MKGVDGDNGDVGDDAEYGRTKWFRLETDNARIARMTYKPLGGALWLIAACTLYISVICVLRAED